MKTRLLFIDTNIYLHFIRESNENIKSLDELERLMQSAEKKIILVFPKITKNEFLRNISLIALGHQKIIDKKIPSTPNIKDPKIIKVYEKYLETLQELSSLYLKSVKSLRERVIKLHGLAEKLNETDEILNKAYFRKIKGDPPGKKDHIGDELVWEMLLQHCNGKDYDLSIVTQDLRWQEMIFDTKDKKDVSIILNEEWESISTGKISIFNTVGEFVNDFTGKQKISKEDIELERDVEIPFVYTGNQYYEPTFFTPPNLGVVSPTSISPSVQQWQPVNVVGGTQELIQCYACGRWVKPSEYYGFTSKGFACIFCVET